MRFLFKFASCINSPTFSWFRFVPLSAWSCVALIVFAGALHLALAASTHSIWLSVSAAAYYAHREQPSQAIAGNELSGSSDTHFGERSYIKHIQPASEWAENEYCARKAADECGESLLSSGQPHSIYLQPAGIVSPNCTFVCAAHTDRESQRRPVRLPASRPLFIHPFKWWAAKVWRNAGSHQKQTNSHILFLRACHRPTFWHRPNFALFFLFQITQFVLWSAQCEAAITQTLRRPFGYMRAPRVCGKTIGERTERGAKGKTRRAHCVLLFRCWSRFVLYVRLRLVWLRALRNWKLLCLLWYKARNTIEFGTGNICA